MFTETESKLIDLLSEGLSEAESCGALHLDPASYRSLWNEIANKIDAGSLIEGADVERALLFERCRAATLSSQLYASESRLRALMEISPVGILIVNGRTGTIVQTNPVCEGLFGYTKALLQGMEVEQLLQQEARELHVKQRTGFLGSIRKRELGYHPPIFARRSDGSLIGLEIGLTATPSTDEVMVVCTSGGESVPREPPTRSAASASEPRARLGD